MFESFLSLLYPRVCVHCKRSLVRGEENLCSDCLEKLPVNERLGDFHELRHAVFSAYMFRTLFYFLKFYKSGITQSLLHQIKYEGNTELATILGLWYGNRLEKEGFRDNFDLVIPVPLHIKKLRTRGYNQSDFIANGLAQILSAEIDINFLKRDINNPTQTRKTRIERMQNVSGIFKINHTRHSQASRILLVDDVLTTGATLESCAVTLLDAGYSDLSFATIAYAKK
jgi:ComF family protein